LVLVREIFPPNGKGNSLFQLKHGMDVSVQPTVFFTTVKCPLENSEAHDSHLSGVEGNKTYETTYTIFSTNTVVVFWSGIQRDRRFQDVHCRRKRRQQLAKKL
jgi:hypothetical protein